LLDEEVNKAVLKIRQSIVADFDKRIKLLPKAEADPRSALFGLTFVTLLQFSKNGSYPRPLVDLFVAVLPVDMVKPAELAEFRADAVLAQLNATTLAMLYDDSVKFAADGDKVRFTPQMKYRYATSLIRVDDEEVGLGRKGDPENEVLTVDGLTKVANDHVGELIDGYPPLGRVAHYAELAAFLRWAVQARGAGKLAAIDLSDLAEYPAYDRARFPTPDAIIR
jgi:hypothetical protein